MRKFTFIIFICLSFSQQIATTKDGKSVVLFDDGTWQYINKSNSEKIVETKQMEVFVTKTGTKYHLNGCRYLKSIIPIGLTDAQSRGYAPCKVCKPPSSTLSNSYKKSTEKSQTQKPKMVSGRCQATTKKGTQCKRNAQADRSYCWQHP